MIKMNIQSDIMTDIKSDIERLRQLDAEFDEQINYFKEMKVAGLVKKQHYTIAPLDTIGVATSKFMCRPKAKK